MATHHHTSPTATMPAHHGPPQGHQPNGYGIAQPPKTLGQALATVNEGVWMQIGALHEQQGDLDSAISAFEQAIKHNYNSIPAMQAISCILRSRDQFALAIDYLRASLKIDPNHGEVWGSLGHCYLMLDNLQEAYSAYQQALYHLQDPKEPKLWYGIGILYDRYGSLEHAEEAFSQVMRMAPDFEKANEVYFRLGIIYKQQKKYRESLECFRYIVQDPPRPLTEEDIWFQIGHVHEMQKDFDAANAAYRRVLDRDPKHAKVLQQLGWLHHQQSSSFAYQEHAIEYLEKSVSADQNDAQSWYLLGRCYMAQQKYPKAYEAYQQAVYRDGRNPTFWCSIGVLYYQINQYRDALDAYSRAIRLNPNISEVWYDLGTLYESCNNQTADALDAYQRAADLDPTNVHIKARLQLLQNGPSNGMPNQNSAPLPQDIHPQAYQPAPVNGPPVPQWGAHPPSQAHQGPAPPAFDYNRRLAEIGHPQAPQQLHPIAPDPIRDAPRPQGPPPATPRPPSPRQEQMRPYQEPSRPNLAGPLRRLTPSPKSQNPMPNHYHGGQNLPPPPPPPAPQQAGPSSTQPERRITNPNYGPQSQPNGPIPPPPAPGTPHVPVPAYRVGTPPEVRPLNLDRPPSAASSYSHQPFAHHASLSIASGAPTPAAALAAAESAARERNDGRPPSSHGPKRMREWEDESSLSRQPNDDKRQRLDDHLARPSSLQPDRASQVSPPRPRSIDPDARRREEEQRRADEEYRPSAVAHQVSSLPPMHQPTHQPTPPNQLQSVPPRLTESVKEERPRDSHPQQSQEPPARKININEDYDDDTETNERSQAPKVERESPKSAQQAGVASGGD